MNREKIRLRPTGLWLLFGPILGCMWLAAVNYSNNLIYGILYLVGSLTFISLFHTWRNLASLEMESARLHAGFAGGQVRVEIFLRNHAAHPAYGLFFARTAERKVVSLARADRNVLRLEGRSTQTVELFFPAECRGKYQLESVVVRTSYPFGLVMASFRVRLDSTYFVYPRMAGSRFLPDSSPCGASGRGLNPQSGDDFAGVRIYAEGESLRHVDWKAYARGRPLAVKQFRGGDAEELWLDRDQLPEMSLEDKLSQLALWVVTAEKENTAYGLRWGGFSVPTGTGPAHARAVLEMLAEVKEE